MKDKSDARGRIIEKKFKISIGLTLIYMEREIRK
jgi:hypothetical protein